MIREHLKTKAVGQHAGFHWRSEEVTRLEGFSDAVFAFAVTLLIVSLEVPKTFDELLNAMQGFIAFGICFLLLVQLWYAHYIWFRRYGLQDVTTVTLNGFLLFVVLFFIYPLKFLFNAAIVNTGRAGYRTLLKYSIPPSEKPLEALARQRRGLYHQATVFQKQDRSIIGAIVTDIRAKPDGYRGSHPQMFPALAASKLDPDQDNIVKEGAWVGIRSS